MKKLVYILAATMVCTTFFGCGNKADADNAATESLQPEASKQYSTNDFALYTTDENLQPVKFLCMLGLDASIIDYTDESTQYISQYLDTDTMEIEEGDKENPGKKIKKDVIRYISYSGSREAVINVRGISTTGPVPDNEKCSKEEDVINAYGIDKDNEEYIEDKIDENSYIIRLNFTDSDENGNVERIISSKGSDITSANARYSLRFSIENGYVHGIDCYMYY
ncbi:MAG: hypothetical protein Q4D26_03700 [Clostridia bacterium]|nr:hypothetical protein [Clostridia bacterium]